MAKLPQKVYNHVKGCERTAYHWNALEKMGHLFGLA